MKSCSCVRNWFLLILSCLVVVGCATPGETKPAAKGEKPAEEVILQNLAYKDQVLSGELINRGQKTAKLVVLTVSFMDSQGKILLTEDFKAVPGGDGKPLASGYSKHFRYQVRFNAGAETPAVSALLKAVY